MGFLAHLQNLQIEGNQLKSIRQDIIKGGTLRILKFLRDNLDAEEAAKITEAKGKPCNSPTSVFPDKYVMKNTRSINLSMKELAHIPDTVFEDALKAEINIVDICRNKFVEVPKG